MDNREIKFRAWDLLELKMIGCETIFSIAPDGSFIQYAEHGFLHNNLNSPESHKEYLTKNGIEIRDEFVLMQFTGLHENAYEQLELNKGIYEGDIIEFINGERLSVEWNDDTFQWQYSDGSPINDGIRYATYKKIIGNTYQNPELLTQNTHTKTTK